MGCMCTCVLCVCVRACVSLSLSLSLLFLNRRGFLGHPVPNLFCMACFEMFISKFVKSQLMPYESLLYPPTFFPTSPSTASPTHLAPTESSFPLALFLSL